MRRWFTHPGAWLFFAFITWNVAFDRYMAMSAFDFTRIQVERRQRGERVESIEDGFRPRLAAAAGWATGWAAGALALGVLVSAATRQRAAQSERA